MYQSETLEIGSRQIGRNASIEETRQRKKNCERNVSMPKTKSRNESSRPCMDGIEFSHFVIRVEFSLFLLDIIVIQPTCPEFTLEMFIRLSVSERVYFTSAALYESLPMCIC